MSQTDDLFEHPLHELLGLDKQLGSIRGLLKVEVAKKVQLEEHTEKKSQAQENPRASQRIRRWHSRRHH